MNCPKHPGKKMTQLFTSWVCDECDPPRTQTSPIANKLWSADPARRLQVYFGPMTINPNGPTVGVVSRLYQPFCGQKIVLLGDSDELFVHGFYVELKSQVPASVKLPVPLEWFKTSPLSSGIRLDTCQAGQDITWMVENRASAPRKFHVAILGVRAIK